MPRGILARPTLAPTFAGVLLVAACVPPRSSQPPVPGAEGPLAAGPVALELEPSRPGARAYGEGVRPPVDRTPLDQAITGAVHEVCRGLGRPEPRWDDRLSLLARDLARVAPEEGALDYDVVEFALSHYGIVEPTPHMFVVWTTRAPVQRITAHVKEKIAAMLGEMSYTRMGVAAAERGEERTVLAVALQVSAVELESVPRRLDAGGRARVRGRVLAPYEKPEVTVALEDGSVAPALAEHRGKTDFNAEVRCGREAGRIQVEVSATGPDGANVLANFPIWCASAPPERFSFVPEGARVVSVTSSAAEATLIELINRDRRAAGLSALTVDPEVAKVARAYSVEMARTGVVAHVSPTSGDASDRLLKAGIRRPLVQENLARSSSVESAHQSLMNSPGHRGNILSAGATHLGVGVVGAVEEAGSTDLIVTEVFVRLPPPVDRPAARARVLAIMKERFGTVEDRDLDVLAQKGADEVARRGTGDAADVQRAGGMEEAAGRFRRLRALLVALADIEQLERENLPSDFMGMRLGVGVGQGSHPTLGPSTLYLVLLVAEPK